MRKRTPGVRRRPGLLAAAKRIRAIKKAALVTGLVLFAGALLLPVITSTHRRVHSVEGPAGGSVSAAPKASPPRPNTVTKRVTVLRGDTLLGILAHAGVDPKEADGLVAALSPLFGPRDLKPGQTIELSLTDPSSGGVQHLDGLQIAVDTAKQVVASLLSPGEFTARVIPQKVTYRPILVSGSIETSLYNAAKAAGLPLGILMEMIRAYSFDVDFQRDVRPGDTFDVIYRRAYDSLGNYVGDGEMSFAALTLHGKAQEIYEFTTSKGYVDYFDRSGQSVRKMLMRTPVEGAWISSVYGWRKNPIYGYTEFHRGLDFAVPVNTPVMAAGNGTVIVAGFNKDYGNYVELQHANGYRTLYAHMVAFARGIRVGSVVSQGDVIGYSGSTGMSTGPHLHYEVIYRGESINPATVVSPTGPTLTGAELEKFLAARDRDDGLYAALKAGRRAASEQGDVAETPSSNASGHQS